MRERLEKQIEEVLLKLLTKEGIPVKNIIFREIPFSEQWGVFTPLAFTLGKENAQTLAEDLSQKLQEYLKEKPFIQKVEAKNGYLNFYFSLPEVAKMTLSEILQNPEYGKGEPKSERVMVEYSQPNTHKAFHIGHLRNVCLGLALSNILKFAGYSVLTANYLGDTGAHVIKCLWGYLRFYEGKEPEVAKGRWLGEVYAEAHRVLTEAEKQAYKSVAGLMRKGAETFSLEMAVEGIAQSLRLPSQIQKELQVLFQIAMKGDDAFLEAVESHSFLLNTLLRELQKNFEEFESTLLQMGLLTPEDTRTLRQYFTYQDELKNLFQRWEAQDPKLVELWEKTREWSIQDFQRIYEELGVQFDVWFYESEMEEPGKEIVKELLQKGVAEESEGAVIVDLDRHNGNGQKGLGVLMILRSDGTPLYSTKDLALAKIKFEQYGIDRSIYVVATPQSLYFQQLFQVLSLWGFHQAKQCFHLAYEIVSLPEGTMSSRAGRVVLYEELSHMLRKKARETVEEKMPHLSPEEKDSIAFSVADGAMKFTMLSRENHKVLIFDPDEALDFEGRSAPYLQYAHARATRILEKSGLPIETVKITNEMEIPPLTSFEAKLVLTFQEFPGIIHRAAKELRPHILTSYLYDMAQQFSDFYHHCDVIHSEEPVRNLRLALVVSFRQILRTGLLLLGITPLERM